MFAGYSRHAGYAGRARRAGGQTAAVVAFFALINCQCLGIISTHLSLQQCKSGCHCVSCCCKSQESAHVQQREENREEVGRVRGRGETAQNETRQDEMQNVMMQLH